MCFNVWEREQVSTVWNLASYHVIQQRIEWGDRYQFSGARRSEGEGYWDLQLAGVRRITLSGVTLWAFVCLFPWGQELVPIVMCVIVLCFLAAADLPPNDQLPQHTRAD